MRDNKLLSELMEMGGNCMGMSNVRPMERAMRRRGYEEEEIRDMEMDMDDMGDTAYEDDMDAGGDEGDMEEEGPDGKKFIDKDEAKEHAKEFLERANEVLQYNKKEAGSDDVCKLATQYAKDYMDAIVDEVNASKYAKTDEEGAGESTEEMEY